MNEKMKYEMLKAMKDLKDAAANVRRVWSEADEKQNDALTNNYPFQKDFNEVEADIENWFDNYRLEIKSVRKMYGVCINEVDESLEKGFYYEMRVIENGTIHVSDPLSNSYEPLFITDMDTVRNNFVLITKETFDLYILLNEQNYDGSAIEQLTKSILSNQE